MAKSRKYYRTRSPNDPEESDYSKLASFIMSRRLTSLWAWTNAECIKCKAVEKDMVKVGAFVMCLTCCCEDFKTDDPVLKEKENYYKWLKVYKEEC